MAKGLVGRLLPAFCGLLLLSSCAQDLGVIDRVQPGALNKKVFDGEWYFQRTVVDVPYTVGYTFIGETEELERVRWQIHEDRLVAYRSYDFIDNTDLARAGSAKPGETVTGQPIASYEILEHFDIQREYNASTGEQVNVLVEDSEDRPWFDRAFIRVNWANNATTNFNFTVDDIPTEPVQFAITDPSDPDAFLLGWRDASASTGWRESRDPTTQREAKSAEYMDFITKIVAKPESFSWWDPWWGPESWPACWFYLNIECKSAEIEIRTSLMRLPAQDGYLPLEYPDNYVARDADGNPIRVVEKSSLIDAQGNVQVNLSEGVKRDPEGHVVRVPMFDKFGYFRTERYGYDNRHGEVESARRYRISRHDIWQSSVDADGKAIPYADREVKPVVYYLGAGIPADLLEPAKQVGAAWDEVFRDVVAALQGKKAADIPTMFVLAENTLKMDADGNVTDRGQRVGDIRFSLLNVVDEPTRAGLLGYGPSSMDPITGKIISASAHSYGGPLREFATMGRDIIRLARGELDPEAFGLGDVTASEVKAMLKPFAPSGQPAPQQSKADHAKLSKQTSAFAAAYTNRPKQKMVHKMKKASMSAWPNYAQARANLIAGTKWEDRLINREVALAFGGKDDHAQAAALPPGAGLGNLSDAQRERMSPRSWMAFAARLHRRQRQQILSRHNIYHKSFADDAVTGLVKSLKDADSAEIWSTVFKAVFLSTALHEVGHTVGLRHNFEATTDALNFHPEYWQLRGIKGQPLDTPSQAQREGGMNDFRYASIMDYVGRFNSDLKGLGRYDRAAIAFGYGELVEVFDDEAANQALGHKLYGAIRQELLYLASEPAVDGDGDDFFGDPAMASRSFALDAASRGLLHYTRLPEVFGGVEGIGKRHWVPYQQLIDEMTAAGTTADGPPKPTRLFEVPYRFCSDEYAEGTSTCTYYDEGVDPREIIQGALSQWRDYYVVNAFRRDRVDFFLWDYESRVRWRYFQPIAIQYQNWVFDQYDPDVFANPGILWNHLYEYRPDSGISEPIWEQSKTGPGLAATAAVREGFTALARVLATPAPGSYCFDKEVNRYTLFTTDTSMPQCKKVEGCYLSDDAEDGCADLVIPLGVGRYPWTEYDYDTGYYFYDRIKYAGAYYDKAAAMETLSDPTTYFIGVDSSQPLNNYILSGFIFFPRELTRVFGAMSSGREDLIGYKVNDRKLVAPELFGEPADLKAAEKLPTVDMPNLYTLRPYAMFLGLAWLNSNWDQTFNDASKIWLDGSGEAFSVPANATVTTFTNPINERVYKSVNMPDTELLSVGSAMLTRAQVLADQYIKYKTQDPKDPDLGWYKYLLDEETQFIELMRGMYDLYGYAWW